VAPQVAGEEQAAKQLAKEAPASVPEQTAAKEAKKPPARGATSTRRTTKRVTASEPKSVERIEKLKRGAPVEPSPETARAVEELEEAEARTAQQRHEAGSAAKTRGAQPEQKIGPGVTKRASPAQSGWGHKGAVAPEEVADHAAEIGHDLAPHANDQLKQGGWKGKFNASHTEKQLVVRNPNRPVYVDHPMCPDCVNFFRKEAQFRGTPQVVVDSEGTKVFKPDGTIDTFAKQRAWRRGP
jgi:hypothetical protein